jgi:hypothetical protein
LLTIFAALGVLILTGIPFLIREKAIPAIEKSSGFDIDCEIRKAGIFSAEINDLIISRKGKIFFEADLVRMKYLFFGLGGVKLARVSGLRIYLEESAKNQEGPDAAKKNSITSICLALESQDEIKRLVFSQDLNNAFPAKIKITGGEILYRFLNGKKIIIPFSCEIESPGKNGAITSFSGKGAAQSAELSLAENLNANRELKISAEVSEIFLEEFLKDASGRANVKIDATASVSALKASLNCEIRNLSYEKGNLKIVSDKEETVKISATLEDKEIKFSIDGINLDKPLRMSGKIENGILTIKEGAMPVIDAKCVLKMAKRGSDEIGFPAPDGEIPLSIEGNVSDSGWEFTAVNNSENREFRILFGAGTALSAKLNLFELSAENDPLNGFNCSAKSDFSEISFAANDSELKIPQMRISAETGKDPGSVQAFAKFANASFRKGLLDFNDIRGDIAFSPGGDKKKGEIKIGKILFNGMDYGSLALKNSLKTDGINIDATYFSPAPGFNLPASFSAKWKPAFSFECAARAEAPLKVDSFDLGAIHKSLTGYKFAGLIGIESKIKFSNGSLSGTFKQTIKEASLANNEKKIFIEGLEGEFQTDDITFKRSLPSQSFRAKSLAFGDAKFADLDVRYEIESPKVFFIERISAGWCGGHLHAYSFRIDGSAKKELIVYCDRVLLSEMLSQFKVCEALGDGRVNGRIPILIENGSLKLNDAFLYSSPGAGGNIKISKTGNLFDSIPKDSPQFSGIDLTAEALKDFNYNWSKISLNNEGDDMLLKIEFSGRSASPLPFMFNKDINAFTRVEADAQGSEFKEIKLDLNCRFPFNTVMRYIKTVKDFFKKGE